MKVCELIEVLLTLPQDAEVVAENDRSDISIVTKEGVEYNDNVVSGDARPRSFGCPYPNEKKSYTGPYVEIYGCPTW